jgi:exodeoxyribonuclease VII large subunit
VSWDLFSSAESAARREAEAARNKARGAPTGPRGRQGRGGRPAAAGMRGLEDELVRFATDGFGILDSADRQADWSVAEVNAAARQVIEGVLPPVWVAGEIANFTRARSGHCYFSLRDEEAQLRCVMWRDEARRLPTEPAEGMQVRALGRLTLYEARGEFQLLVSVLEGRGDGLWKLAFERLRARLDAEGLTSPERKRPVPPFPACVGVVTSADGAALRDIVSVVRRRAPWTRLVLAGCRVQGDGAAAEIAAAIERIGRFGGADVLIVARGGGSVEDLWAFNDEGVARAIAASPVPVISGVGHETDVTIADLVADLRAPTPSVAAEAAVPDGIALRDRVAELRRCLADAMLHCTASGREGVGDARARLQSAAARQVQARRERLRGAAAHLQALSPLATLARGYAVPLDPEGRVLRHAQQFRPGTRFVLRVADGQAPCTVNDDHGAE